VSRDPPRGIRRRAERSGIRPVESGSGVASDDRLHPVGRLVERTYSHIDDLFVMKRFDLTATRAAALKGNRVPVRPLDVSEPGHCVTQARRLRCRRTKVSRRMSSVLKELALSYAVLSEGLRGGSAPDVHEPSAAEPPYRASASPITPAGPSAHATPPQRSPPSSALRVRLHLKPGQNGTKRLLAQYGDRLICVRYRYDAKCKKRLKTVELLVAERDWEPPRPRLAPDHVVGLRVVFADTAVRDRVKRAGGTWNPERRVWQLRYDRVVELGLTSRIVQERVSNRRCSEPSRGHLDTNALDAST
jgi:hypothetical protein